MFFPKIKVNKFSKLGLVSLTALSLAACSGGNSDTASSEGKGDQVKIEFWTTNQSEYKEEVAEFEKANPDIDVVTSYQGNYDEMAQKVQAAVVAKSLPEVAQLGQRHGIPQMADSGQLIPIEDLISKEDVDDIYEGFWNRFRYKDQLWTIPFQSSTPIMYYNKTLFDEQGLEAPKTWDELVAAAEKVTIDKDGDGTNEVWGFNMAADTPWYFQPMTWNRGGRLINEDGSVSLNSAEAVETLESFKNLVHESKAMPANQHATAVEDFAAGRVAILFTSGASIGEVREQIGDSFEFATAFLPEINERNVPIGGNSLGVFKSTSEQEEASVKLVEFLTSAEKTAEFSMETGYIPVRKSAMEIPEFKTYLEENPTAKVTIDQMEYLFGQPINPADSLIWNELVTILEKVASDKNADSQQLLDDLQEEVSTFIKDYEGK